MADGETEMGDLIKHDFTFGQVDIQAVGSQAGQGLVQLSVVSFFRRRVDKDVVDVRT